MAAKHSISSPTGRNGVNFLYTITIDTTFKASHQLTLVDGQKESLHSHDWIVRTAVCVEELDQMQLAIDFHELKSMVQRITAPFEGSQLEKMSCFEGVNASAEIVAKYIYDKIRPLLAGHLNLDYVEVTEEAQCRAKYSK